MMSTEGRCSQFPCRLKLSKYRQHGTASTGDCETVKDGFVRDKLQLETVLGQSNPSWFEQLTEQRLERRVAHKPFQPAVFDSPSSPTISQLISVSALRVGSSPNFSYDSPLPSSYSSYRQSPVHTPDNWSDWKKPLLGLSPSPRQPTPNRSISHPSIAGVQSLGVLADDSALFWTNSLATPPRDISDMSSDLNTSATNQKELVRVLFSPGDNLDTTNDSVQPLDSTFEEDPDLQTDHSDQHETDRPQSGNFNNSSDSISLSKVKNNVEKSPCLISESKPAFITENISGFAEMSCESDTEETSTVASDIGVSKILKDGDMKKGQSSGPDCGDQIYQKTGSAIKPNSSIQKCGDKKSVVHTRAKIDLKKSVENMDNDCREDIQNTETVQVSPTFTQKCSRKCFKTKTANRKKKGTRLTEISVDEALSDFFDSPATVARKRRRNSNMSGRNHVDSLNSSPSILNVDESEIRCSTPKVRSNSLQSILSSKKSKSSSGKKVRFSENVKKYSISSEYPSILKNRTDKSMDVLRPETRKVKFEEVILSYKEIKTDVDCDTEKRIEGQETSIDETGDCRLVDSSKTVEIKNRTPNKPISNDVTKLVEKSPMPVKCSDDKMGISDNVDGAGDGFRKCNTLADEFSQISPSSLNEMCSVADQTGSFIAGEKLAAANTSDAKVSQTNNNTQVQSDAKCSANLTSKTRKQMAIRFMYPSKSHVATSCQKTIFKYEESSQTQQSGLVTPVLASHIVSPNINYGKDTKKAAKHDSMEQDNQELETWKNMVQKIPSSSKRKSESQEKQGDTCLRNTTLEDLETNRKHIDSLKKESDSHATLTSQISGPNQGFLCASGRAISLTTESLDKASRLLSEEGNTGDSISSCSDPHTTETAVTLKTFETQSEPGVSVDRHNGSHRPVETSRNEVKEVIDFSDEWAEDFNYDPTEPDSNPEQLESMQIDVDDTESHITLHNDTTENPQNKVLNNSTEFVKTVKTTANRTNIDKMNNQESLMKYSKTNLQFNPNNSSVHRGQDVEPNSHSKLLNAEHNKSMMPSVSVCDFSGFKTASGKKLECSTEAMKKAESYMNEEGCDQPVKQFISEQYKGIDVESKSFKSSVIPAVLNQQKHEAMQQGFSSACQSVKPDTATLNAGFSTASGKNLTMSDVHMNKARSVLGEILEEDAVPNNDEIPLRKTRGNSNKPSIAESLKAEFENDLLSMPTDIDSMMEEFKTVKNSRANENLRKVEREDTKVPSTKPAITAAQNVPQGFRPFKRPRLCGNKNALSGNKYPESKSSDWGSKEKNAQNTTDNVSKNISGVTKIEHRSENRKTEEHPDKEMTNITNNTNRENLVTNSNVSDLYQGLSQMFADELDSSFEATNNSSCKPEKATATPAAVSTEVSRHTELRPVQDIDINVSKASTGFATASGKSLSLSSTFLMSAQKLFESMEDSEGKSEKENISKVVPDSSSEKTQDSVHTAHMVERSGGHQTVRDNSNQLAVSMVNSHFNNMKTNDIQSSNTSVFSNSGELKEQIGPTSLCKSSLNTSIASMENDSVGRQEQMEDKAENELLSSAELENMDSVHVQQTVTKQLPEKPGTSLDTESIDKTDILKQLTYDRASSTIQENADTHSRNSVLNQKDYISIFQGGFQTASGKHIAISEKAMEESKTMLNESNKDSVVANGSVLNNSVNKRDLNTAGTGILNKDTISAEINTKSSIGKIHKELEFLREIVGKEIVCEFETAKGKAVNVSQRPFKDVKQSLEQSIDKHGPLLDVDCADIKMKNVTSFQLQTSTGLGGFQTASGKCVNISAESVERARKVIDSKLLDGQDSDLLTNNDYEKGSTTSTKGFSLCSSNCKPETMFQTASGKAVQISDQAFVVAKRKLETSDDENSKFGETDFQNGLQFPSTTGKSVKVSKQVCGVVQGSKHRNENNLDLCKLTEAESFFQTASGKKVDVSVQALKLAKNKLNDNDENDVAFAEKTYDTVDNVKCSPVPFQTASGNVVKVSDKALAFAKKTLDDTADDVKSFSPANPFQTASGNIVKVSDNALAFAKKTLDDSTEVLKFTSSANPFKTASGTAVQISDKALAFAKKTLDETDDTVKSFSSANPFQTASGNLVKVSDKALAFSKKTLDETDDTVKSFSPANPFQTASGNLVKVSNKALAFAKKTLDETDDTVKSFSPANPFQTASGNLVKVSNKALAFAKKTLDETDDTVKSFSPANPFQTASGNVVKVSEKSLAFAKKTLDDSSDDINLARSSNPFQTASGTAVKVSEKSLAFAKKTLDDSCDNIPSTSSSNPFQTASGTTVQISAKALAFAKKTLDNTAEDVKSFSPANPFQTASGTAVQISDNALAFAKETLDDTADDVKSFGSANPIQTASGCKVNVSDKALALARKTLESKQEELDLRKDGALPGKSNGNASENDGGMFRSAKPEKLTSETGIDDFNTELLSLKKERDRLLKNRISNSEETSEETAVKLLLSGRGTKHWNEPGSSGLPLKRQKLEDGMEKTFDAVLDRDSLKRKPVRTRPEGTTTDRRHPGYRPFIPVRSKVLQKTAPTLESIEPAITACGSKTDLSGPKPSFHTPYRASATGQQNTQVTSHKIKVTMPIFRTKSTMDEKPDKHNPETAEQRLQQDLADMATGDAMLTGNIAMETDQVVSSKNITKQNGIVEMDCESGINESNEVTVKINAEVESSKAEDLDSDMASYSQDEEDMFYCNLVEARKQQGELISKKGRVKPMEGRLYEMKQTAGRWQLKDLIRRNNNACGISYNMTGVCAASAGQYRFVLDDHYSKHTAHVLVGDGAFLVPDDAGYAGKTEFYRAFLTLDGVDSKLISEAWLYNHYRWVVWKLAAYEVCLPALVGRCLTPEMMMLQLKYRYDREIDLAQRSAIRKIFERDDTASKRMVLCVAGIQHVSAEGAVVQTGSHLNHPDSKVVLELTDGWYSIKAHTDVPLADLVNRGKVWPGQKICISGAEVIGADNACSPLEAPESVMLKLCCNSARPCSWDSPLGYQRDPRPLCVPLCGLYGEGGAVGMVDVVIVRKYPILYMEKLPGGGNVFRTSRCEEKVRQEFESRKEVDMQRLYQDIMAEVDKEKQQDNKQGRVTRSSRKWTPGAVEAMNTGQEIYEGLNSAQQPDSFQSYLSEHQLNLLYEYQRQMQEVKQSALNTRLQDAWRDRQESAPDRNVTPVLKFRISGCSRKDMDNSTSTILTVWRPAPEISDLQEGKRYRIYSLNSSTSRSKYTGHTVQLTATKQTKFQLMPVDENFLDNIYEPREVLWVSDVKRRKPAYGELDFVGLVVKVISADEVESGKPCDTVYLADCQGSYLAIKVWSGFKSFGEDLFSVGNVMCCCNLMDKSSFRSQHLPTVEAPSEFTFLTKTPQNSGQRKAVERLNSVMKDRKSFLENMQTTLDDMLYGRPILTELKMTPSRHTEAESPLQSRLVKNNIQSNTPENVEDSFKTPTKASSDKTEQESDSKSPEPADNGTVTPVSGPLKEKKSIYQAKMARLLSYSSPSCLSPMNTPVPRSVRKGFKPPAFKKV